MSTNSEWGIFIEPDHTVRKYYCKECKSFTGLLHRRTCKDSDNEVHREYKIVCERCSQASQMHWSKNLTEFSWQAINPNMKDDYISVSVSDMMKKG